MFPFGLIDCINAWSPPAHTQDGGRVRRGKQGVTEERLSTESALLAGHPLFLYIRIIIEIMRFCGPNLLKLDSAMTRFLFAGLSLFLFVIVLILAPHEVRASSSPEVRVIPISGEVSPAMAAFVKRAAKEAHGASLVIFELDTFGGRVDSALKIVDTITHMEVPSAAWVKSKAISAGALIALSADALYMKSGTTFGDCAPITMSQDGPKMLGEKFQSPLRAKFRALARKNGYSEVLAESMVSADLEILSYEKDGTTLYVDRHDYEEMKEKPEHVKTVVKKGELLTMDDVEAKLLGFSKESLATADAVAQAFGYEGVEQKRVTPSWSEEFSGWILTIAPILMMIGLGALYAEIKAPGFGVLGVIGIVALGLALFGHHLAGLATYAEMMLIVLGFLLIVVEILIIPGFGVAGIAGFLMILVGLLLSLQDFTLPDPSLPWEATLFKVNLASVVLSFGGSLLLAMGAVRWLVPAMGRRVSGPYLEADLKESKAFSKESDRVSVGEKGRAITPLRPAGKARFGGEPFDVVTQGDFIAAGESVKVCAVDGNRIVVSKEES